MLKTRGLGRGLDALLGSEPTAPDQLKKLAISALQPGKYQPRTNMKNDSLAELAESIKSQGVMQPILVREIHQGRYEIIAGERRWRAAKMAGLNEIPVVIKDVPDNAALAIALIENIQREDLNPIEEANGIQRLINEFGMTHQSAALGVGRSRSGVTNLLRLLNLAKPVQDLLQEGKLEMGHARSLLALSQAQQMKISEQVIQQRLSVRQTEALVRRTEQGTQPRATRKKEDRDVQRLQEEVSDKLGTTVSIQTGKSGSGRLIIAYASLKQLDDILDRLK